MTESKDTKRCPFCGEEIKAAAIKCKHCGEFFNGETDTKKQLPETSGSVGKNIGIGCAWIIGIFILLCIIGSFIPDSDNSSYDTNNETNVAEETYSENSKVTGSYSGFGPFAVAMANNGGQMFNCLEKGAGQSLVEQIETIFEKSSETYKPEYYSMKDYNPNLKFVITNPHWAETVNFMPEACLADIEFYNVKSDTIMGYQGDTPLTIEDVDCRVSYTVSEQNGKYKANIFDTFCKPNAGYR